MVKLQKSLTKKQINTIKDILLAEKERLINKSRTDDKFCLDKNELSDMVDEASVNIQASQELRFRNRENFYLKKINNSLHLISQNMFGTCEDCGENIGFERLKARPTAELCINCKEEAEGVERNNVHLKKSKSLGKTLAEI